MSGAAKHAKALKRAARKKKKNDKALKMKKRQKVGSGLAWPQSFDDIPGMR